MSENMIEVKNITKTFHLNKQKGIFGKMRKFNSRSSNNDRINALDDVSFTVSKGEVLGIIGKNGSGKTTLLQVIAGLYELDSGEVKVNGSLTPILQIGIGFQQELIPRENIVMYGMLLGLTKREIMEKLDRILEFAELEKFTEMKLKHFSSGMKSRLAISTTLQLNPDIFLLDEILAVGDLGFREKCFKEFSKFKEKGTTILYVTHNLNSLPKLCDRVLLLHLGRIIVIDNPADAIQKYKEILQKNKTS